MRKCVNNCEDLLYIYFKIFLLGDPEGRIKFVQRRKELQLVA